jgi:hypothetical protein
MGKYSETVAAKVGGENNQHCSCKAHHVGVSPKKDRGGTKGTVGEG